MTRNSSDTRWLKPSLVLAALVAACVLWAYLAGGIFMVAHRHQFDDATPLTLYQYWFYYGAQKSVQRWLYLSGGIAFAMLLAPAIFFFAPAKRSLFGDARFAKTREIRRVGLLQRDKGIIVGRLGRRFLTFGGSQHVIVAAPTRSGKGVGIVIPNLLNWPDSVVVLDVKQENHSITSGFRAKHKQACYLFNPAATDYRSHRYNPLSYISDDPNFRIDDIQKIAGMLFPDQPGTDVIWTATPRTLFLGVVLSLLETPGKPITLGQVLRETLADGDGSQYFGHLISVRALGARVKLATPEEAAAQARLDIQTVLAGRNKGLEQHPRLPDMAVWSFLSPGYRAALAKRAGELRVADRAMPDIMALVAAMPVDEMSSRSGTAFSDACVRALNAYISISSENTRAGVMTSFRSRLELWSNPLVDAATSANDFDLRDVRRRRMSIYLGVSPDNLDRLAPLINLFFQQLIDLNTRELPEFNAALKYQCLIVGDEFTAPGKMGVLSKGIAYIAGYGLRLMPIIQSPAQLVEVYGKDAAQTFLTNHALQVVFPPKASELQTAKDVSEWLGYQTVTGKSESKGKNILTKRERSENTSDQRRALLLPQEITSLGKDKELVVVEDCPPILATKVRYFADRVFTNRLKSVAPSLAAIRRTIPTEAELRRAVKAGELASHVPEIDLAAHHAMLANGATQQCIPHAPGSGGTQTIVVERPLAAADVANLPALALDDFAIDFSGIEPPARGELDIAALHAYADSLTRAAGVEVEPI